MHHSVDIVSIGRVMAKSLRDAIDDYDRQREVLVKRQEEVSAELIRVESILDNLRRAEAIASREELTGIQVPDPGHLSATSANSNNTGSRQQPALTPDEVLKEARAVLLENGKPLKRGNIVRAIEAKGMIVPGADKAKNLGTILWRAEHAFVSIEGYGYWPADIPIQGIYKPS